MIVWSIAVLLVLVDAMVRASGRDPDPDIMRFAMIVLIAAWVLDVLGRVVDDIKGGL